MGVLESIIGGIVAMVLGGILTFGWQRYFYPYILEWFSEPTKRSKSYSTTLDFGSGPNHKLILRISKLGRSVKGEIGFIGGRHAGKVYPLIGTYRNPILTFFYWSKPEFGTSQGGGSFKRLKDGALLKGSFAYYSQESDSVESVQCELKPMEPNLR